MAYPQSSLPSDVQDAAYGGAPANRFGTPARSFIDSCIQAIEKIILTHVRVPFTAQVVVSGSGNAVGDVAYFDEGQFVSAQGYYARNVFSGTPNAIVWGVFADAATAGGKARVITSGVISPQITGLPVQTAGTPVGVNLATGRLRVAASGDPVVGYFDVQGNVFLLAPSRPTAFSSGFSAITTGTGDGHEYLDVTLGSAFPSATGASGYTVEVQISLTTATDPGIVWWIVNKTTTGFRINFSGDFNGEVRWRVW